MRPMLWSLEECEVCVIIYWTDSHACCHGRLLFRSFRIAVLRAMFNAFHQFSKMQMASEPPCVDSKFHVDGH